MQTGIHSRFLVILAAFLFSCYSWMMGQGEFTPFVEFVPPPALLLDANDISNLVRQQGNTDFERAFRPTRFLAEEALDREPRPLFEIQYDGLISNHPDKISTVSHLQDMTYIRALTYTWLITKEEKYLERLKNYILAWARNYRPTGNDINENKLDACFIAFYYLKPVWTNIESKEVALFLSSIAQKQLGLARESQSSGHHAAKRVKLVALAGLILENEALKAWAMTNFKKVLDKTLYKDGITYDLIRRDALYYHASGLANLLEVAIVSQKLGSNMYNEKTLLGGSLRRSIEFTLPYITGEERHREWVNTTVELDRDSWEAGDSFYEPGRVWNPNEAYDLILLASLFDPSLFNLVSSLRKEPSWTEVLVRTIINQRF